MNVHTPLLSLREIQVLRLAAEGLTAKATAGVLNLSVSAVNLYLMHARQKLGAKTKAEAIAMLMESNEVLSGSIENINSAARHRSIQQSEQLHEMLYISNKMRHLLEDMLIADAARKTNCSDFAVWNDLAERFLKRAAEACGYEIVKQTGPTGTHSQAANEELPPLLRSPQSTVALTTNRCHMPTVETVALESLWEEQPSALCKFDLALEENV